MQDLKPLHDAILNGDAPTARSVTEQAIAAGAKAMDLVNNAMVPAMAEVGRRFECEDFFVPDLLLAARAMKSALEPLKPLLAASDAPRAGRVVIGTVKGDLHEIGKNLVAAMLEGSGFEVFDLGVDVSPEKFAKAASEQNADIVAMSALLTTTMGSMRSTIESLKAAGIRDRVKVLIGGAPISQKYADDIGADGFADNAVSAVTLARQVLTRAA